MAASGPNPTRQSTIQAAISAFDCDSLPELDRNSDAFLRIFKAGMIAVPINIRMKTPEIAYILEHSKSATYFAHRDMLTEAEEAKSACGQLDAMHTTLGTPYAEDLGLCL